VRTARQASSSSGPARGGRSARRAAALALGAAVAAGAGCSASVRVAADPAAAVRDAGTLSTRLHSALIGTSVTESVGGSAIQYTGDGAFDFDRGVGEVQLTLPGSRSPLQEIVTPAELYMRSPAMGAKWARVETARLADGDLVSAGYTSPVLAFALLEGVGGPGTSVRYVGQDAVQGTPVAHYAGTLDLKAAATAARQPVRSELQAAARTLTSTAIPFDAYLDSAGVVRRVVAHYSFRATAPQKGVVRITSSTDLYDLGSAVTVSVPTAGDLLPEPGASLTPSPGTEPDHSPAATPSPRPGVAAEHS
jgi:hypothetical protein